MNRSLAISPPTSCRLKLDPPHPQAPDRYGQKQAVTGLRISYHPDWQAWEKRDMQRVSASFTIKVTSLARLFDEPKMLPSAFYTSSLARGVISDGWR